ncbi:MAG: hypothetical protein K5930_02220 [Treponemataceae bacterium]|nr:hypothetical protein [Treponemataceae bacterium]
MKLSVKLFICLIISIFLFASCSFDIVLKTQKKNTSTTQTTGTNTPTGSGTGTETGAGSGSGSGTATGNGGGTGTGSGTESGNGSGSGTGSGNENPDNDPEPIQVSRTLSFSEFTTTPNNGGKYYKIPSGTLEVTIKNLPLNKIVRLVRINPSERALENLGTVSLYSRFESSVNSKSAAASDSEKIENILPSTIDSPSSSPYDEDQPHPIPFIDDTDYASLLFDLEDDNYRDGMSNRMVAESSEANYTLGATKLFNVRKGDSGSWSSISATLRAVGDYCYIWIADTNYSNSSSVNNDNKLNMTQIQTLAANFDSLYQIETAVLGDSYKTNPNSNTYINPQRKISILFYDINNDYDQNATGGTFGKFWPNDFYKTNVGSGTISLSNEMELIYVDAHFTDKYPQIIISTIAHEFEHMLYYVNKTMIKSTNPLTWFHELGAMMTEDLLATYIQGEYSSFNPAKDSTMGRMREMNSYYYDGGITNWNTETDQKSFNTYARAGIFGCWLLRNYGGVKLLRQLIQNDYTAVESIQAAFSTLGYSDTLNQAFTKYALSFAQPDAESYTLNKTSSSSFSSYSFPLLAINPWDTNYKGYEIDSENQRSWLQYTGPKYVSEDYNETMQGYGFWITGWHSETYTQVTLRISKHSGEENYIVISD